jgi:hypothetical protein
MLCHANLSMREIFTVKSCNAAMDGKRTACSLAGSDIHDKRGTGITWNDFFSFLYFITFFKVMN